MEGLFGDFMIVFCIGLTIGYYIGRVDNGSN